MRYFVDEVVKTDEGLVKTGAIRSVSPPEMSDFDYMRYFPQIWDITCRKLAARVGVDLKAMRKAAKQKEFNALHGINTP